MDADPTGHSIQSLNVAFLYLDECIFCRSRNGSGIG